MKNIEFDKNVRFISPMDDTAFKFLWRKEDSRKWFSKLIKLITNIDLDEYELVNPELNSGNDIKDYILDILFVRKDKHESVNIEMYNTDNKINHIKSGQYAFRLLGDRMKKGEEYIEHSLVQVNFFNAFFKDNKDINIICYQERDESGEYSNNYLKKYDVYLLNYKGLCYNEANELDAMLSFLTGENYDELRRIANGNKEALDIVRDLEDLAMKEKYWGVYDKNKENIIMQNSLYREGKEEGREEGRKEGKAEEKIDIAKNLLQIGISIEQISNVTGLSEEQIEELKQD